MKGFRGKKSDRVDARNIAMQVEFGNVRDAMPYTELRELVSRYWFLRQEAFGLKLGLGGTCFYLAGILGLLRLSLS